MTFIRVVIKLIFTALVMVAISKFPMWGTNYYTFYEVTIQRILPFTLIPPILLLLWFRSARTDEKPNLLQWVRNSKIILFLFTVIIPSAVIISTFVVVLPFYRAAHYFNQLPPPQNDYWFSFYVSTTGKTLREHVADETYEDYLYYKNIPKSEHQEEQKYNEEDEILTEQEYYERKQDQLKYLDRLEAGEVAFEAYLDSIIYLRFIVCLFILLWPFALICTDSGAKQLSAHLIYSVLIGLILILFAHMFEEYPFEEHLSPLSLYIIVAALPALLSVAVFKVRMLFKNTDC